MRALDLAQVNVRSARVNDVTAVLRLWHLARSPASINNDRPGGVKRLLAHDETALLVAEFDNRLIGTVIAAWNGWRGHLYRLAVLPEYRRRGVGRRLVTAGEARLRARGATRIDAAVRDEELGSGEFWVAVGFRRDPGVSRFAKRL